MRRRRVEEKNLGSGISLKGRRLVRDRFQIWQEKERIGQRELERFDQFDQFDQFLKQQ
jgi:hypothetical protein